LELYALTAKSKSSPISGSQTLSGEKITRAKSKYSYFWKANTSRPKNIKSQ
jgi:hypothetical protein